MRGLEITLDEVAEHAGVGVGTVYRRFANKQELIVGVFEENVQHLAEQADLALEYDDPWEGLEAFFEYACRHLAVNRGFADVINSSEEFVDRFTCLRERIEPAVDRIVDRARDAGVLRPGIQRADFFALIHMVAAMADFARPVNPNTWQRYFGLILDAVKADGMPRNELTVPPLTNAEVDAAKAAACVRRR